MKNKKSTGVECISSYVLKKCAPYMIRALHEIINTTIKNCIFPSCLKISGKTDFQKRDNRWCSAPEQTRFERRTRHSSSIAYGMSIYLSVDYYMEISRYVMLIKSSFRPHRISYKLNTVYMFHTRNYIWMLVFPGRPKPPSRRLRNVLPQWFERKYIPSKDLINGKAQAAIQAPNERASTMIRAEEHPQ
jgi:hypothetical protein